VLNAEAQLFQTRANLAKARYDTIMAGLRLKSTTGALTEDDIVQINTLLTASPQSMYRLPAAPATAGAPTGRGGKRGTARREASITAPRS
jgi:outer membrane protein